MGLVGTAFKLVGGLVSFALVLVAIFVGWLIQTPQGPADGLLFATVFPLLKGQLPATIIGHGKMTGVPVVPSHMTPQPRSAQEITLPLPFDQAMPAIGLGMCCRPTAYDQELVRRTVLWYLLQGGRLIDTAYIYLNHPGIAQALVQAQERGLDRAEVFVTTKHWPRFFGYNTTLTMVPQFLKELQVDYIDLVLMHAPANMMPVGASPECFSKTNRQCRQDTWKALSELRQQGLIRNIGVSNFGVSHLQDLKGIGSPIAVNQISYNPWSPDFQVATFEYCQSHGIAVTAYNSLGGYLQKSEAASVQVLNEMAQKYSVSVSAILLRWALQKGAAVIPGTGNPKHMQDNLNVYNLELSPEDMARLDDMRKDQKVAKKFFTMKFGD